MTGKENGEQADRVNADMRADDDRDMIVWLESRVPHEVPAEVTSAIRSSITAELAVVSSEPEMRSASVAVSATVTERRMPSLGAGKLTHPARQEVAAYVERRMPSLGFATAALVVVGMGLNVLIVWRSDHRVATLVGDHGLQGHSETVTQGTEQLAVKKIGVSDFFEYNVSLFQQELNYERIESHSTRPRSRRREEIRPPEEKTLEENLDRSGAATRPGPGLQRFSKLAGGLTD